MDTKMQEPDVTRLSFIHPYPAMIADSLANDIAAQYITSSSRLLDPFCGTARTVAAAAERGARSYGADVNPLAVLISQAKIGRLRAGELKKVSESSLSFRGGGAEAVELESGRTVNWFSAQARSELSEIIHWLNTVPISTAALKMCAVVLSATVRDVSFCRKHQWKLHRMCPEDRSRYRRSPWAVFDGRIKRIISELESVPCLAGHVEIAHGDATRLLDCRRIASAAPFNLVFTSPPYGDSRTTVGYGDVSALCLGVVRHLRMLNIPCVSGGVINASCLGGRRSQEKGIGDISKYWFGGVNNPGRSRVAFFLADLQTACIQLDRVLDRKATLIFVVARRNVGGRRLYIDRFLYDVFRPLGFRLEAQRTRRIVGKSTPTAVDTRGAGSTSLIRKTMKEELVLVLKRDRR